MNKTLHAFVCIVVLVVSGCKKPVAVVYENKPAIDEQREYLIDQLQAKLYDIPFPLASEKVRLISDPSYLPHTCTFMSQTLLSHDDLVTLYHTEMERLGWQELSFVRADNQSVAVFQKPSRSTTILIEKNDHGCVVRTFVQQELIIS